MNKKALNSIDLIRKQLDNPLFQMVTKQQSLFEKINTPARVMAREMQNRIDQFYSPGYRAVLKSQKAAKMMLNSNEEFLNYFQISNQHLLFNRKIETSLFFMKSITIGQDIYRLLNNLNLAPEYLISLQADDLELEEYELDFIAKSEPEKKTIYLHEANRLYATILDIYNNKDLLYKISPREFEEVIAELLRKKNFEVELTKQTRDGGYDLIAVQNLAGFPLRFLVECKRYAKNRPVGIDIIRSFSHVVQTTNANKGILFTSSYFSPDANQHRVKNMPHLLDFKDNGDIMDWIKNYIQPPLYL